MHVLDRDSLVTATGGRTTAYYDRTVALSALGSAVNDLKYSTWQQQSSASTLLPLVMMMAMR